MADSITRVGGSNWTVFQWNNKPLALANVISDTTPSPVATAQAIQPLDADHPIEIITSRAVGAGTLRVTIFEKWENHIWSQLAGLETSKTLLDIFKQQVKIGAITCQKIIKKPDGGFRAKNYYNCVITDANDSETIQIGTMSMPKDLVIMYTHYTEV